jgi:hypothetical protein
VTAQPHLPFKPATPVLGPGDPDYDRWWSELQYYLSVREKLWERQELRSKYIALKDHKIVDEDMDRFELARRAELAYPGEVVFISKVELTDPVINLPMMEVR